MVIYWDCCLVFFAGSETIKFIVLKQMDKLVKTIKQHYQQEQNKEVGVKVA